MMKVEIRRVLNIAKRELLGEGQTLKMMGIRRPDNIGRSYQNMIPFEEGTNRVSNMLNIVPDEIVQQMVAAGSPSQIIEKLVEYERAGATDVMIHFIGEGKSQMEEFSESILNQFH